MGASGATAGAVPGIPSAGAGAFSAAGLSGAKTGGVRSRFSLWRDGGWRAGRGRRGWCGHPSRRSDRRSDHGAATARADYRASTARVTARNGSPASVATARPAAAVTAAMATGPVPTTVTSGITTASRNIGDCAAAIPSTAAATVVAAAAGRRSAPPPPGIGLGGTQRQPKDCRARNEHLPQTCATHFPSPKHFARNWIQ